MEGLAGLLRTGKAGSNAAADDVNVLGMTLALLRPRPGRGQGALPPAGRTTTCGSSRPQELGTVSPTVSWISASAASNRLDHAVPVGGVHSGQTAERHGQLAGQLLPLVLPGGHQPGKIAEPALGKRLEHGVVRAFIDTLIPPSSTDARA